MVTENDYLIKKAFYQVGFDLCKEKKEIEMQYFLSPGIE